MLVLWSVLLAWLFSLVAYDVFQCSNIDMMASLANMHPAAAAGDLVKPMVLCWRLLVDH
jgi:hypothetical protein